MRGSLYDAPDRPLQTYPSMPAISFPPAPAAPAVAPAAASAAVQTPPSAPVVPTWSEAPPRDSAPVETPIETPVAEEEPPVPAEPIPSPIFESSPPAPAEPAAPIAPPVPEPPPVAPSAPPAQQTWTPVEAPVWKPGSAVPAEPLGTGYAIEAPKFETRPPAPAKVEPEPAPAAAWAPAAPASPEPARKPAAAARPRIPVGLPTERPPWLVPAAVAVIIVLLLGALGVVVLPRIGSSGGNPIATVSGKPSSHPTASARASASPSQTGVPQAVPTYGPAAAAPVTKVQFCTTANACPIAVGTPNETGTNCDLSACTVEVAIYFSSQQKVPVAYTLKFFDRCTGQTTDLPGPPDFTPPGYAVVIPRDKWAVSIPGGVKSAALVAITSKPAVAASAPLTLGGDSC